MSTYYLGPDGNLYSEEELYHWKYIKREKVNGKWKYYYDKDVLRFSATDKEEKPQNGKYT